MDSLTTSINSVVYALRRNKNWSIENSYRKGIKSNSTLRMSEHINCILSEYSFPLRETTLLRNFTILKNSKTNDPLLILDPFLQIIKSGETTGSITMAAIEGIDRLIQMDIIGKLYLGFYPRLKPPKYNSSYK